MKVTKKVLEKNARKFLTRHDYDFIAFGSKQKPYYAVAKDPNKDLHFIIVDYIKGKEKDKGLDCMFDKLENKIDREDFEQRVIQYLIKNKMLDECRIYLDTLYFYVIGEDSAFLRHHIGYGMKGEKTNDRI